MYNTVQYHICFTNRIPKKRWQTRVIFSSSHLLIFSSSSSSLSLSLWTLIRGPMHLCGLCFLGQARMHIKSIFYSTYVSVCLSVCTGGWEMASNHETITPSCLHPTTSFFSFFLSFFLSFVLGMLALFFFFSDTSESGRVR